MDDKKRLEDDDLARLIRDVMKKTDAGYIPEAQEGAQRLREAGVVPNMHVGAPEFKLGTATRRMVLEWYAGSFMDIVETGSWWAMNSLVHQLDHFCPDPVKEEGR